MTINDIKEMITENDWDFYYERIGIRIQEQPFTLGEIDHVSHIWIDNEDTEEELGGICAIDINDINSHIVNDMLRGRRYFGGHIALIGGDLDECGEDVGEIILKNAEVLYIIK